MSKAEYIALGYAAKKAVWIRRFMNKIANELQLDMVVDMILHGDNKMSNTLTKNANSWY